MGGNSLYNILSSFHGVNGEEDDLLPQFAEIARYVLSGGYFLINNERKIYLIDIEFYYHEEGSEGKKVKDPIMYHTYDHEKNTKKVKESNNELPYFPLCSLNTHVSGIDITFESKKEKYRASFLIRGYRRDDNTTEVRSTQIYEDFFMGVPLSSNIVLEWKDEGNLCSPLDIESTVRLRVSAYKKDSQGNYITDANGNYIKDYTIKDGREVFKQCPRKWRFIRKK